MGFLVFIYVHLRLGDLVTSLLLSSLCITVFKRKNGAYSNSH